MTNSIPTAKTYIKSSISTEDKNLKTSLTCKDLGNSLFDIQDAICGKFLGGLDSLWFSYAVLGFFAALSMPAIIYAANKLFAYKFATVNPESPSIMDKGFKFGKKPKVILQVTQGPAVKKTFPDEEDGMTKSRPVQIYIR